MQCVLAVRETVVIKPSRLNIVEQGLSNSLPDPSLSPCTHISLKKERGRAASTLNTHRQASLMVSLYTTFDPHLRSCIGPAREAGLSTGTWKGHVQPRKERNKRNKNTYWPLIYGKDLLSLVHNLIFTPLTVNSFTILGRINPPHNIYESRPIVLVS